MEERQKIEQLRSALLLILDCVDYTTRNCCINDMVAAVLPQEAINRARETLSETKPE